MEDASAAEEALTKADGKDGVEDAVLTTQQVGVGRELLFRFRTVFARPGGL